MKPRYLAYVFAVIAGSSASVHADSATQWGHWDSNAKSPFPLGTTFSPPGLHVQVIDGLINFQSLAGSGIWKSREFGHPSTLAQMPVVMPFNLGLQWTPPPSLTATTQVQPPPPPPPSPLPSPCLPLCPSPGIPSGPSPGAPLGPAS